MSDQPVPVSTILKQADSELPSLNYAVALQVLAAQVGFDWPDITGVVDKIKEELDEVLAETDIANNQARLKDEIGDLLFACTNLARHLNIDPEQALQHSNDKFYRRFSQIESIAVQQNRTLPEYTLSELNALWQLVKKQEK